MYNFGHPVEGARDNFFKLFLTKLVYYSLYIISFLVLHIDFWTGNLSCFGFKKNEKIVFFDTLFGASKIGIFFFVFF